LTEIYLYNEQDEEFPVEVSRETIIKEYWPFWEKRMIDKFGVGHELITEDNCIDDWVVVHWAWRK